MSKKRIIKIKNKLLVLAYILGLILILSSCKNAPSIYQGNNEANGEIDSEEEKAKQEALKKVTIGREAYETIGKEYVEADTSDKTKATTTSGSDKSDEEVGGDSVDNESADSNEDLDAEKDNIDEDSSGYLSGKKRNHLDIDYHTTDPIIERKIYLDKKYRFATFSEISEGHATLYIVNKKVVDNFKNKIVAVNAGHGTVGGTRKRTYSHPDFTPKVAGGTNKEGSVFSAAVSDGTVLLDGKQEATANLMVAMALKEKLLNEGYSVLMLREDKNCRLDNIARTVLANENADIHIAIHFDSTERDKGIFYMKPINNRDYLNMEPLKSNVDNINNLGQCLIDAFKEKGEKVWKGIGYLEGDLTQIAFSTNASVDIELGDRATFLDDERAKVFADGLLLGIQKYFALAP